MNPKYIDYCIARILDKYERVAQKDERLKPGQRTLLGMIIREELRRGTTITQKDLRDFEAENSFAKGTASRVYRAFLTFVERNRGLYPGPVQGAWDDFHHEVMHHPASYKAVSKGASAFIEAYQVFLERSV